MTNPNPLYPKGSTYTLEEFIPVVRAAQKMGLTDEYHSCWFSERSSTGEWNLLHLRSDMTYTLLRDIQAPYEPQDDKPPVKPLTVEEIKAAAKVWFSNPEKNGYVDWCNGLPYKGALVALNIPCYATEDDCQRAHKLGWS